MKVKFFRDGMIRETVYFKKDSVYDLEPNRAISWMMKGCCESVPAFEGEVLPDPFEEVLPVVESVKVDVEIPKVDDKSLPIKRGKKSNAKEKHISENLGEVL